MSGQTGIAIAADFTADPIKDTLALWSRQFGWDDEIVFAPYDQILQSLIDPAGLLPQNRGINIVLLRAHRATEPFVTELNRAIDVYWSGGGAPLLVALCPSQQTDGVEPALPLERDSVYFIAPEEVTRLYPVDRIFDAHAESLGDIPYTPQYFAALGTVLARRIHALRMKPYKVIALDCDNTLWRGTCGEDGPEGVVIDPSRRYLQAFMRERRDSGMLLALASKNNRQDVMETFQAHQDMPLRFDDFVFDSIDWSSKGVGFARMAKALNLGMDSFIFVDDSPKEIGEVRAAHPQVLGLSLPHDEERIPAFLDHVWAFDQLRVTQEDRERNQSYRQQLQRAELESAAVKLGEFIEQLQVEVNIQPLKTGQAARVSQLTQRTNQMNTTLVRRTEAEIGRMLSSDPPSCLTVDVADRFGSYGLVGVLFLSQAVTTLRIEGMLLSCRALGRGVEHRMLSHAGRIAVARGLEFVEVLYREGPRNMPARQFLDLIASSTTGAYRIPAAKCAEIKYQPDAEVVPAEEKPQPLQTSGPQASHDYSRIARELSSVSQIVSAMEADRRQTTRQVHEGEPPRGAREIQIAEVWAEVLHVPVPGRDVDFFDLGGHSLIAVQLLAKVRQEMGVELQLDLIYTGRLTVSSMAAAVELAEADPQEVDRLLAEIDSLSEEELQALLESE